MLGRTAESTEEDGQETILSFGEVSYPCEDNENGIVYAVDSLIKPIPFMTIDSKFVVLICDEASSYETLRRQTLFRDTGLCCCGVRDIDICTAIRDLLCLYF